MASKFWQKEWYVIRYGQSSKFRILKWIILIAVSIVIYFVKGAEILSRVWVILIILGISLHFFFRYKTKGWTQPWGRLKPPNPPLN